MQKTSAQRFHNISKAEKYLETDFLFLSEHSDQHVSNPSLEFVDKNFEVKFVSRCNFIILAPK